MTTPPRNRPSDPGAAEPGEVTRLLHEMRGGNQDALNELLPLVYRELRHQAARYLRGEGRGHTLQPTALVHEAYLRLIENPNIQWQNRAHFCAVAARLMRRILVDHARTRGAQKRGGAATRVTLDDPASPAEPRFVDLLILDESLSRLADRDARQAQIVELRVFGGLSVDEAAGVLDVSPRTVKSDWQMARAWLTRELRAGRADPPDAANRV